MYETLTGKPPLRGNSVLETIQKQISQTPRSLDDIVEEYAPYKGLIDFTDRSLAKQPEVRPQNFAQVKSELNSALEEIFRIQEKSEHKPEKVEQKSKVVPSKATALLLSAMILISLLALGAGVMFYRSQPEDKPIKDAIVKKVKT